MIASWVVYALVASATLGLAALVLERALRAARLPVRFVWAGAMAGSVLLPLLAWLRPSPGPAGPAAGPAAVLLAAPLEIAAQARPHAPLLLDRPLLLAWASATLLLALFVALSAWGLARRRRRWRAAVVAGERVEVSRDVGPAVVGFLRSAIVVPEWVLETGADQLELLVAHEKEHLRAHDGRLLLAALALPVLLPWNLALWWQLRRLRLAVEVDCDARVVRGRPDLRAYALLLLEVGGRATRGVLPILAFARRESFLERRLRIMIEPTPRNRWIRLLAGALAAMALTTVACELRSPSEPGPRAAAAPDASAGPRAAAVPAGPEGDAPRLTPFTTAPELTNRAEVVAALEASYPRPLREAGIEGSTTVWLYIDETGRVVRTQIRRSSGHEALDEAALEVAGAMRFTPARDGDERIPAWIAFPVVFTVEGAAGASALGTGEAGGTRAPELLNRGAVADALSELYPPLLRDAGIGGTVELAVLVGPEGRVARTTVRRSSGRQELDVAALRIADVMEFEPARGPDGPVSTWLQFPIVFAPK